VAIVASQCAATPPQLPDCRHRFRWPGSTWNQALPTCRNLHPVALTANDLDLAAWTRHQETLQNDNQKRASMPTQAQMDVELERLMQIIEAGGVDVERDPYGMINLYSDYELMISARDHDANLRQRRLAAMRLALAAGETRHVDAAVQNYVTAQRLMVAPGSTEWRELAQVVARAEIDALERTLERDRGVFGRPPSDPIVKPSVAVSDVLSSVPLKYLFDRYIAARQAIGKHKDGGANWRNSFATLIKFLGHGDARRITKRNLLDWRDAMLASGTSARTISDKHLAAISAVLKWAFENDYLPSNEASTVRQEVPRKPQTRERGYTTAEAVKVLQATLSYKPSDTHNPSNRESSHTTAARRWGPLLCAFTGARVTEITQLRKEDFRKEGDRWIMRITPAGSVKTGQYRDVPLHQQVVALEFIDFVGAASHGPLFHAARSPEKNQAASRATAGKLSKWLNDLDLVPAGVQPSSGWRHRFKSQGRELAISDRVLDALQGHPGRTASDSYGDDDSYRNPASAVQSWKRYRSAMSFSISTLPLGTARQSMQSISGAECPRRGDSQQFDPA